MVLVANYLSNSANGGENRKHSASVWVGVLGTLAVIRDGRELPSLPAAQRAVLGLLAMADRSPVRLDTFIEVLWGEAPPASAPGIVHTYISRLRRILDTAAGDNAARRLIRDGAGYRMHVGDDELDLLAFRRLSAAARQAHAAGDADSACTAYERALSLWRGEPLEDVDALRGHPAVVALADEHAAAVLDYADMAMASGRPDLVVPHLRALAVRRQLDEAVHARLMTALAGSGHQADALQAFEELRRRLDEELGVLPGLELREAHAQILHQNIRLPAGYDAARDAWLPVFQLPAAPADFTGRAKESARLMAAITPRPDQPGVPLTVICGPPGAGKTALALHVAHIASSQFPDGQLWVHLAGMSARPRDPGDVLGEFLRALGVHGSGIPHSLPERAAFYRSRLAGRRMLVVADDAVTADQVRPLMPGTRGCALLVTSRSRLEGLGGVQLIPLDMMTTEDAASLLSRIVGNDRVAADPESADSLIQACGALPLAVRIAGAKLAARPSWPLSLMTQRLTGAHARLRELESGDLSVRASITSSYVTLSERASRAFRLLALLGPADFAEWTIAALLGESEVPDVVSELEGRSMLTAAGADATGEPRYRFHDLLRCFAAECLDEVPRTEPEQALERLLRGWLQLVMLADDRLPPEPYFPPPAHYPRPDVIPPAVANRMTANPIAWFNSERVNLLAAVHEACETGRLDLAHQLASHQGYFQHLEYRDDDVERVWRMIAVAAERFADPGLASTALLRIAASFVMRAQPTDAIPLLERCATIARHADDIETLALASYWRGFCAHEIDDFARALRDAEQGVSLSRKARSRVAELMNLRLLANAFAWLGDPEGAVPAAEAAVAIAADLGAPTYDLVATLTLTHTYYKVGKYEQAVSQGSRALELSRRLGDICLEALSLGMLADAYQELGRFEEAASNLSRALPAFREQSNRRYQALCLLKLGYAHEAMRSPLAIGYLEESLRIFRQLHLPRKADQAQQALDRCRATLRSAGACHVS